MGQAEEALAFVRGAHAGRREQNPFRIEPERGKVSKDGAEAQSKVPCHVLKEDPFRPDFADDAGDVGPNPSRVVESASLAGDGEWLARIAGGDEIDKTSDRICWKVGKVAAPNRRRLQARVFHPGQQDGRGVGFPLDVHQRTSVGSGDADAEFESSNAGAERKDAGISHVTESPSG